jgi:hypothetical protein
MRHSEIRLGTISVSSEWWHGWLTRVGQNESYGNQREQLFDTDYPPSEEFVAGWDACDRLAESARCHVLLNELRKAENVWIGWY